LIVHVKQMHNVHLFDMYNKVCKLYGAYIK
jgi:hypothetical protein